MKILTDLAKKAAKAITIDMEKREGGVIVMRKLLPANAKKWHDWAVRHGVPNPVPPEEMHVTVIMSAVDVRMPLIEVPITVQTAGVSPWSGSGGVFAMFGPEEDVLVFSFRCWELHDRHWMMLENGCITTWPTYRPHLTLSYDAGGFDLPDEAMQDVPTYVIMDGETSAVPKPKSALAGKSVADDSLVEVSDALKVAAADALKAHGEKMNLIDAYDLADISKGRMLASVQKRLSAAEWAPEGLKKAAAPELAAGDPKVIEANGRKFVERDVKMTVGAIPDEVKAKGGKILDAFKTNEEEKLAYGWASVSTVKGEFVEDLQGDTITTKAQRQWLHSLIRSQRIGKMEHEGDQVGEVVEGIVLDKSLQDALGVDLGMEGCLVCTHYTCEKTWDMVKTGNWMYSIAGRVLVEVEEEEQS